MTLWPLIHRELRCSSRRRSAWDLRLTGAGLLLVAFLLFTLSSDNGLPAGAKLFSYLHLTLFGAIWMLVPFLTADCLSRERRERTLGLLFLTEIKAGPIVTAKVFAQALKALTLWIAVLPILVLPFLLGGIGWREVLISVSINLGAICLALGAGLLSSAMAESTSRTTVLAVCFTAFFCASFTILTPLAVIQRMGWLKRVFSTIGWGFAHEGFMFTIDAGGVWSRPIGPRQTAQWVQGTALSAAGSVLLLGIIILFAAWKTRRSWAQQTTHPFVQWLLRTFCRPVLLRGFLRDWTRRSLERNPVAWLQQRSWTGRLIAWIWLGLVVLFCSGALLFPYSLGRNGSLYSIMGALLVLALTTAAIGSFRYERECGLLELLLVSTLGEQNIISGRLRGLWTQFLPGTLVLILLWSYAYSLNVSDSFRQSSHLVNMFCTLVAFITVPIIGFYFSLRFKSFAGALLATLATFLTIPGLVSMYWWLNFGSRATYPDNSFPSLTVAMCSVLAAALLWRGIFKRLRTTGLN